MPLLEVRKLQKSFSVTQGFFQRTIPCIPAVEDVSFELRQGETLGLVGESGCGKTTVGKLLVRLLRPTSGNITLDGIDYGDASSKHLKAWRRNIQMIFQDPFGSLNPRMCVQDIVQEGMKIHQLGSRAEISEQALYLLQAVGLGSDVMNRFPHEFSGGQRQRINIARALAVKPKVIVADEPVSALDVSIQAQMINLLIDLQESHQHVAYLFISHDLRVVEFISHRIAIMYLGRIMETLSALYLHKFACHPYTQALLGAIPVPDPTMRKQRHLLLGDVPTFVNFPSGCVFHTRCPRACKQCKQEIPVLRPIGKDHFVACHLI